MCMYAMRVSKPLTAINEANNSCGRTALERQCVTFTRHPSCGSDEASEATTTAEDHVSQLDDARDYFRQARAKPSFSYRRIVKLKRFSFCLAFTRQESRTVRLFSLFVHFLLLLLNYTKQAKSHTFLYTKVNKTKLNNEN